MSDRNELYTRRRNDDPDLCQEPDGQEVDEETLQRMAAESREAQLRDGGAAATPAPASTEPAADPGVCEEPAPMTPARAPGPDMSVDPAAASRAPEELNASVDPNMSVEPDATRAPEPEPNMSVDPEATRAPEPEPNMSVDPAATRAPEPNMSVDPAAAPAPAATPAPAPAPAATPAPGGPGPDAATSGPAAAPGEAPMSNFDRLVCEDVMAANLTSPMDPTVQPTSQVVDTAATTGQREPEGWGAKTMSAITKAVLGPVSSGWRDDKVKQWDGIWGNKSIYGTGGWATLQKTIASVRMVVDTIGSVAGTVGLWSSLLSLVGLIPGLQPIGAFLATVGEICTIIGIAASAINIALSALNIVVTLARMLAEKVGWAEPGADYASIFVDDVFNIGMSVVSIGLSSAGGSMRAGVGGAQGAKEAGKSMIGGFFRGAGQQFQKTLGRNLARTGLPGMARVGTAVSADAVTAAGGSMRNLGDMWRTIYRDQATRWASTAVARGLASGDGASAQLGKMSAGQVDDAALAAWRQENAAIRAALRTEYQATSKVLLSGGDNTGRTIFRYGGYQAGGQSLQQGQSSIRSMVPAAQPWVQSTGPGGAVIRSGTSGAIAKALGSGTLPTASGRDVVGNAASRWIRSTAIKSPLSVGSSAAKKELKDGLHGDEPAVNRKRTGTEDPSGASAPSVAARGLADAGHAIPYQQEMSRRFGADLSGVRAHTGPEAQAATRSLGAEAYTMDGHVGFGSASPNRATVAHELTHVVQQTSGVRMKSQSGPHDDVEREAEAAENVSRPPALPPSRLPGALSVLAGSGGGNLVASVQARAAAATRALEKSIHDPAMFKGQDGPLPPEKGPMAGEYVAQVGAQRELLAKMKDGIAQRRAEAKIAVTESREATDAGAKWSQLAVGLRGDMGGMKQKYAQKRTELAADNAKVGEGIQKSDEIQGKASGMKGKAESGTSRGNVQGARYPANPTTWQRIKRFFLEGIVGRFNRALDRGKQILMNIITKAVMGAMQMDSFKAKLMEGKGQADAGQKNIQKAEGTVGRGEQQTQKMERDGTDLRTQGEQKAAKAQALDAELASQDAAVTAKMAALDARAAELQATKAGFRAKYGPGIDATNAEIDKANAGVGLEEHSTATVDPDIAAISESAAEIQAASQQSVADVAASARTVGDAARGDVTDAMPGTSRAGSVDALASSVVARHREMEAQRAARVQAVVSEAQGLAGQLPTPANTRRLGELHRRLEAEAAGIEQSKSATLQTMHGEFSSLYQELVQASAGGPTAGAAAP